MENREINREGAEQTTNLPAPPASSTSLSRSLPLLEFVWWDLTLRLENDVFLPASQISSISEVIKKNNNKKKKTHGSIPSSLVHAAHGLFAN